ncbi:hypothetical protein LTR04_004793 [Oleoguttula sp. CCFEE 6159]|nr:hypothetical protein LTR04_004793 [Oleoguttula sp. CCFEE 6159]
MRAILPGKPQLKLQAVTTGLWEGTQVTAYISGNALVILDGPKSILQTTYHDDTLSLEAVLLEEATGKIATCSTSAIYVYSPYRRDDFALKANFALFSPCDASLIASCGRYDRLVKLWRRLSFETADFDFSYLPHPTTVTGIQWRKPKSAEQEQNRRSEGNGDVLYTISADGKVRVWTPGDAHGLDILQLWAEIDTVESLKPRNVPVGEGNKRRYAFVVDSRDFFAATASAMQQSADDETDQRALAHLKEVAKAEPEIVVVLDDRGNMSAWGLESVGCKARKRTDVFNITHVEGLRLGFGRPNKGVEDNARFHTFYKSGEDEGFAVLVHHFDGTIEWWQASIADLLDPGPRKDRLRLRTTWTGHSGPIKKVIRTADGRAVISRTEMNKSVVWTQRTTISETALARKSRVIMREHIHRVLLLQGGDFVIFLHHESILLWDTRRAMAVEVARCRYRLEGKPLCLILVPEAEAHHDSAYVATIGSNGKGIAWTVKLPSNTKQRQPGISDRSQKFDIEEFCTFDINPGDNLAFILPVDPAGSAPVISGFLDPFARDVAISYTKSGTVKSWTARVSREEAKIEWLLTSTIETGLNNLFLASGTSIRKAALVDSAKTTLTIWDTKSAQLEYEERFDGQGIIQDLDWASTPDNQSILAVGFPHRVLIYAQLRYDYLNAGPSWASIREIDIGHLTPHPIGDSVWLGNGDLVIGAGNQLFTQDKTVEVGERLVPDIRVGKSQKEKIDLFKIVQRLNGPLPVFHPQFLAQCILAGKLMLAQRILLEFFKVLKFYTEGDHLDPLLGIPLEDFTNDQETSYNHSRKELQSSYADFTDTEDPASVTEEVATSLNELLMQKQVPQLSSQEQFHLADIIECVGTVENHRRSIDENASRYLLFFRQFVIRIGSHRNQTHGSDAGQPGERRGLDGIGWREITWALHSGSQDILVDLVSRHYKGRMLWQHARESGVFMWMSDINALRAQFETIARNEYTRTDEKNPVDCSLYYLALKRKAVLIGLWRMATWSREQGATLRLLSQNFNEARWKTAALKNAYALLGKRRFEYAAAFFLLAGNLQDAISILSNQMQDTQLAIAVARVYEGDSGPVLRRFLEEKVLPQAAQDGDRWRATWAFWLLGNRSSAVRALVSPLHTLLSPPGSPGPSSHRAKSFLRDDPALAVLYKQLREKSLQTLRGAAMVQGAEEWGFVMRTVRLLGRMGCQVLALDLVRSWEFLTPPPPALPPLPTTEMLRQHHQLRQPAQQSPSALEGFDPRKMLRRRSSLVVADLPPPVSPRAQVQRTVSLLDDFEMDNGRKEQGGKEKEKEKEEEKESKGGEVKKEPPKVFKEPDANSLLDAFGF